MMRPRCGQDDRIREHAREARLSQVIEKIPSARNFEPQGKAWFSLCFMLPDTYTLPEKWRKHSPPHLLQGSGSGG